MNRTTVIPQISEVSQNSASISEDDYASKKKKVRPHPKLKNGVEKDTTDFKKKKSETKFISNCEISNQKNTKVTSSENVYVIGDSKEKENTKSEPNLVKIKIWTPSKQSFDYVKDNSINKTFKKETIETSDKTQLKPIKSSPERPPGDLKSWNAAFKAIKVKEEQEIKDVKKKYEKEMYELKEIIKSEKAAICEWAKKNKESQNCGHCKLNIVTEFFNCTNCAESICYTHIGNMTTCTVCEKKYCDNCLRKINICSGCAECPQLTCCDLGKMPCGEWEHGDCQYYHHKHCRCQKKSYY